MTPAVNRHQGMIVLDAHGKLAGMITRGDLLRALDQSPSGEMTVLEAGDAQGDSLLIPMRYCMRLCRKCCATILGDYPWSSVKTLIVWSVIWGVLE